MADAGVNKDAAVRAEVEDEDPDLVNPRAPSSRAIAPSLKAKFLIALIIHKPTDSFVPRRELPTMWVRNTSVEVTHAHPPFTKKEWSHPLPRNLL